MGYLEALLAIIQSLNRHAVSYVLIDGGALNVHGLIRATEDLDVFIEPTADNVERLKQALRSLWDDPAIDEIAASDLLGDYPAVRYGPPEGDVYLDILTRLGDLAGFADLESEEIDIDGVPVRVATSDTLYRLKRSRSDRSIGPTLRRCATPSTWRTTMPIDRYRSAFDMPRPPRAENDSLGARIAAAFERAHAGHAPEPPRGVQRFRTLEEAREERARRTRDRVRRLRARRTRDTRQP